MSVHKNSITFLYRYNTASLVLFYLIADPLVGPEKAPTTIEKKRCCTTFRKISLHSLSEDAGRGGVKEADAGGRKKSKGIFNNIFI
jgi:hypothetical protein